MVSNPNEIGREIDPSRSRRHFFNWISKVAGGASLAGIGLRITDSTTALAATRTTNHDGEVAILASKSRREQKDIPEGCITCNNCMELECVYNVSRCPSDPYNYYVLWDITTGCEPNCTDHYYASCATACYNPC